MKAKKFDKGKPKISHIPSRSLVGVADAFNFGEKKYGRFNYCNGMEHTRPLDSAMPHIYHALASLFMYDHSRINSPELDDRMPKKKRGRK